MQWSKNYAMLCALITFCKRLEIEKQHNIIIDLHDF